MANYYIGADYCGMNEGEAMNKIASILRGCGHTVTVGSVSPEQEAASYSVSKNSIFLFLVCGVPPATIWSFKEAIAAGSSPPTIFLHGGWMASNPSSPMGSEQAMLNMAFNPEHDSGGFVNPSAMSSDAGEANTVKAYCEKYSQYVGTAWASSPEEMGKKICNGQVTGFGGSGYSAGSNSGGTGGTTQSNTSPLLTGDMTFEELVGELCNGIDLMFLCKRSTIVVTDFESIFAEAMYLRENHYSSVSNEDVKVWQLEEDSYELDINQHGFYNTVYVKYNGGVVKETYDDFVRVYGEMSITYKDPKIDKKTAQMKAKAYLAAHLRDLEMTVNATILTEPEIDIGDIVTLDNPLTQPNYNKKLNKQPPEYLFVKGVNTSWEGDSNISTDLEMQFSPTSPKKKEVPTAGVSTGDGTTSGGGSGGVSGAFNSYGVSSDGQHVLSIAQPSAGRSDSYSYNTTYATVFVNKCPRCGKAELRWDSGMSGASCITCGGYHGSKSSWGDISEGEVSCNSCCSDFCGVTGWEKDGSFASKLTTYKAPVQVSKEDKHKLAQGTYSL